MLALSYLLTSRQRLFSLEFAYWLISYQFIFIGLLGIGLIQSHLGCRLIIGDCYFEGYPEELYIFKLLLELLVVAWVLGAIVMSVFNVISLWWKSSRDE